MFDWNDQELTDIIWGETCENDDHTVPYPEGSEGKALPYGGTVKKEFDVEDSDIKPTDKKKPKTKIDRNNIEQESSSRHDTSRDTITAGFKIESTTTKIGHDSSGVEASGDLREVLNHECFKDERNQLDDDSPNLHPQKEDLEQGDLIDYSWANIGSFDDLDNIFSNGEPIFGDTSLLNTQGLWSSCKEVTSSPDKSIPLSIDSSSLSLGSLQSPPERLEVKAEYMLDQEKSSTGDEVNINDIVSNLCTDARDHGDDRSVMLLKEKENSQKRMLKGRLKLEQEGELAQLQELCGSLSPRPEKFDLSYVRNQPCPASELNQQRQLQGLESLHHKHFPGPLFGVSTYEDTRNQYSPVPVWPQFHSGQASHQSNLSSYKASPSNSNHSGKSIDASAQPSMMTPQEKVEKLRRRQQLRAMLAIQKQQQQFNYQILPTEQSGKGGESVEENLGRMHSLDPSSPLEQGDSNTVCLAVEDFPVEDTTLYLLQEVISKLDPQIRLCIRDSLFRLAQSATQRQCGNNSCISLEGGSEVNNEDINPSNRIVRPPNAETETNPIDRTVAHLLFHNPSEFTSKLAEIPRSSMFAMLNCERKAIGSLCFPNRGLQQNSETSPSTAHQEPKTPTSRNEADKTRSRSSTENSEKASNNEGADGTLIGA